MLPRFEAIYYEGEFNERMPAWQVIEWTSHNPANGARSGRTVESFDYQDQARELAYVLQENYNREFFDNHG